jgi:hypothetical protein
MIEGAEQSAREVSIGMILVLALLALLLVIPVAALLVGWWRRQRLCRSTECARTGQGGLADPWSEAGRRERSPSVEELERQYRDERSKGDA